MKRLSVLLFFCLVFYSLFCQCNDCEICDNDCDIYKSSFNFVRTEFGIHSTILVDMKIAEQTLVDKIDQLEYYSFSYGYNMDKRVLVLNEDSCFLCNLPYLQDSVLCKNNIYHLGNNDYLECFLDSTLNVKIEKDADRAYSAYAEQHEDEDNVEISWIYFRNILYINSEYAFFTLYVAKSVSKSKISFGQNFVGLILHKKQNEWEVIRAKHGRTI